ncbi:MAG TPA: hypothetical protein P5256_11955 [Beijerinckiaceae bacterium]|nr:hypothetical protein [Rhodoblastus sp.]MCC2106184.1 hypothetical protein [Hyphomicrobiales bacterium]HRY03840.1 hypothetical protein [Beijerinckiaceae bacterium]
MLRFVFAYTLLSENVMNFEEIHAANEADAIAAGLRKLGMDIADADAEDLKATAFDCDMIVGAHQIG